jgi:hypothetical protein
MDTIQPSQFIFNESSSAAKLGFRFGNKGAHASRTMMLTELELLFDSRPNTATQDDYFDAILEDNVTDKRTHTTRQSTRQRLTELYSLDPSLAIFRVMRELWEKDKPGRPLLALLCTLARDPLLRATAPYILNLSPGDEVARNKFTDSLRQSVGDRFNDNTLDKIVRNTASTWTQSGHLAGRVRKSRQLVNATPLTVAYALLLGHMLGRSGNRAFQTLWTLVLDSSWTELFEKATDASRLGVIKLKQSGDVTQLDFPGLISKQELKVINESN